jgi:hypothetical protein
MSVLSPADRARRASMRVGLVIAILAFLVVGGDVLLDKWITGYASAVFILGTAALIAGICIGLFAIIGAWIGDSRRVEGQSGDAAGLEGPSITTNDRSWPRRQRGS